MQSEVAGSQIDPKCMHGKLIVLISFEIYMEYREY